MLGFMVPSLRGLIEMIKKKNVLYFLYCCIFLAEL